MSNARQPGYCKVCQSNTFFGWNESSHLLCSIFTLAMIGGPFLTLMTGSFLAFIWVASILASRSWGCLYCARIRKPQAAC